MCQDAGGAGDDDDGDDDNGDDYNDDDDKNDNDEIIEGHETSLFWFFSTVDYFCTYLHISNKQIIIMMVDNNDDNTNGNDNYDDDYENKMFLLDCLDCAYQK